MVPADDNTGFLSRLGQIFALDCALMSMIDVDDACTPLSLFSFALIV